MRFTLREIITATFGLAALVVIVEHAGGFSQILQSGASAYGEAYTALIGKGTWHPNPSATARRA